MNTDSLEEHICSFGLNNEILQEQPKSLSEYYGKGLLLWQYPNQLAPFIKWLCNVKVNSYLEIGCRWGGTFVVVSEILKRNNPHMKLIACDLIPESNVLIEYRKHAEFEYTTYPSGSSEFSFYVGKDIEMVFIDGDHSYDGCLRDWSLFKNNPKTKHIVFHDIDSSECVSVGRIWKQIKEEHSNEFVFNEFVKQYPKTDVPLGRNFLGIGSASRKEK